jgi:hypothetical protein
MLTESIMSLAPLEEPSIKETPEIVISSTSEVKENLIQETLKPDSMIQGQRPMDLINLLKYKLEQAGKKYQENFGEKITKNEWESQLKGNLRGIVFERLSSLIPVNSTKNLTFTTLTEEQPISTSSIQPLKKVTRFFETKSALINSITEDRAKQKELQANIVIPDNILIGPKDEIVGFVEDKCYTPDEIQDLADKLEKGPKDLTHTLDKEIAFLKLVSEIRQEKLGIGTKPITVRGKDQLPQQPEIRKENTVIVIRFPSDAPQESLRKIGIVLATNGYQVEIQTLPFSSDETNEIGKTLLRNNSAMIHYGVGNPSFSKEEITMVESYADITPNDVENNLVEVAKRKLSPEELKELSGMSLIEKLYK